MTANKVPVSPIEVEAISTPVPLVKASPLNLAIVPWVVELAVTFKIPPEPVKFVVLVNCTSPLAIVEVPSPKTYRALPVPILAVLASMLTILPVVTPVPLISNTLPVKVALPVTCNSPPL